MPFFIYIHLDLIEKYGEDEIKSLGKNAASVGYCLKKLGYIREMMQYNRGKLWIKNQ